MQRLNPTVLALIGGLVILLLLVAYFASNRNPDQDKLTSPETSAAQASDPGKKCGTNATYALIKRELFRRAAQIRGSDQAAYDKLSGIAVVRMDNPVMESQDDASGAINCSGLLTLDLPPGVVVAGGRSNLMSNVDYTIQPAADDSGDVVLLRNADAIIGPLATLTRVSEPQQAPVETNAPGEQENAAASESANIQPGPASSYPGRPSFDCNDARSKGEIAVCSDAGLSALDVNMAAQYRRALAAADGEQREILQGTRDRFVLYRDHCPNRQCIADAYVGRMREIRDIMEGRWKQQ